MFPSWGARTCHTQLTWWLVLTIIKVYGGLMPPVLTVLTCWAASEKVGTQKVALYVPNCYGASSCWGVRGQAGQANAIKLLNNTQRYVKIMMWLVNEQCIYICYQICTMFQQVQSSKTYLVSLFVCDDLEILIFTTKWDTTRGVVQETVNLI